MDDLVTWLREQIDEDEQVARRADHADPAPWCTEGHERDARVLTYTGGVFHGSSGDMRLAVAEHIARHDPARVLREVKAKRRILDGIASRLDEDEDDHRWEGADAETDGMASTVLRLLALPYADRPGYRDEWRTDVAPDL
jgi:hypothetical protein